MTLYKLWFLCLTHPTQFKGLSDPNPTLPHPSRWWVSTHTHTHIHVAVTFSAFSNFLKTRFSTCTLKTSHGIHRLPLLGKGSAGNPREDALDPEELPAGAMTSLNVDALSCKEKFSGLTSKSAAFTFWLPEWQSLPKGVTHLFPHCLRTVRSNCFPPVTTCSAHY